MQPRNMNNSCAGLITAFVASTLIACAGALPVKADENRSSNWPAPSTPAELPPAEPPFAGKIKEYVTRSTPAWPKPPTAPRGAPNVVIILIDDAGFGATDLFGGPIKTPALDQLAAQGLKYNDFNVTALCSPTRAALLSGRNPHRVGFGFIPLFPSGYPGYNGIWSRSTACIAEVLRDNGYSTAVFGKWHNTPHNEISPVGPFDLWPTGLGFQYFYGFMAGQDSEFEPRIFQDTTPIYPQKPPSEGYYFTTDMTDRAIAWLRTHEALAPGRPYFLYFATGATHVPHQVQREWISRYKDRFNEGWDKLRQEIFARQKALGIVPANTDLTPRPKGIPAWGSLSPDAKRLYARQMAVYAGFMAETDHQIGRLLRVIESEPDASNTLIFYIAGDNGASGEGGIEGADQSLTRIFGREALAQQLEHIDLLGGPDFDNQYGAGWAWALDTPFKWMKRIASNFGGTRDPLVVAWPIRIKDRGALRTQFIDVDDVVPTVYQVAGITPPSRVEGIKQQPLDGTSFAYTFDHPRAPSRHRVQYFETLGNRAIYEDGWVAAARHGLPWPSVGVRLDAGYASDEWRLYHVASDFSEAHDLARKYPGKLAALRKVFDSEARLNDVYPLGASAQGIAGGPSLIQGRHEFVFYPSLPPTPVIALPIFSSLFRYRIRAELMVPNSDTRGVLLSYGTRLAGFVLYVNRGALVYENNNGLSRAIVASREKLPLGKVTVGLDYAPAARHFWGAATLYVNGKSVGARVFESLPYYYFGSLSIGRSYNSPVSAAYRGPFAFTGVVKKITINSSAENRLK